MSASAIIGALGTLGTTFYQARAARRQARLTREFNVQQMEEMRRYNHPEQQMQRLQEAGLNPMLMYGQGDMGNQSQPVTGEFQTPPHVDPFSTLSNYYNIKGKEQHIKYEKKKTDTENVRAYFVQSQISNMMSQTRLRDIETDLLNAIYNEKSEQEIQRTLIMYAQKEIAQKHAEWTKAGMNPQDATWLRMTIELLQSFGMESTPFDSMYKNMMEHERKSGQRYEDLKHKHLIR